MIIWYPGRAVSLLDTKCCLLYIQTDSFNDTKPDCSRHKGRIRSYPRITLHLMTLKEVYRV